MAAGQIPVIAVLHPREWPSAQCLLLECQLLTELAHPNIVRCLSFVEDEHAVPHMYLELCAGTLEALVKEGHLSAVDRVRLAWHVVSAMAHVHDRGYLHYDLKMNNILVTMADGVWTVKVSDFGCARSVKKRNATATEADAGKFPEVAAALQIAKTESAAPDLRCITRASDVYIFGKRVLSELFRTKAFPSSATGAPHPMMAARALCGQKNPSSRPQFSELRELFYRYLKSAGAAAM
jgi:serine/threonine protein kinase